MLYSYAYVSGFRREISFLFITENSVRAVPDDISEYGKFLRYGVVEALCYSLAFIESIL